MQQRFYVLRDYTLFVYKDSFQKYPSNLIILKGTYIDLLESSKEDKYFGFRIQSEYKTFKTIKLYH